MTGEAGDTRRQITMLPSFSLYVTATNVELIKQASPNDAIGIFAEVMVKLKEAGA